MIDRPKRTPKLRSPPVFILPPKLKKNRRKPKSLRTNKTKPIAKTHLPRDQLATPKKDKLVEGHDFGVSETGE